VLKEDERKHPVLTGVKDIYGPTDVYGATLPMLQKLGATPLVFGQVLESLDPASAPVRGSKDKNANVRNPLSLGLFWRKRRRRQVLKCVGSGVLIYVFEKRPPRARLQSNRSDSGTLTTSLSVPEVRMTPRPR
jgi:hypothetical protein